MRKWMLPEQIDDILPAEAERLESLRRTLLDHFRDHGYRLVQPPLIEHLDSLLTGTGHDLELQTFKVIDPLSGRLLGVRADITPQVARIDAHLLNEPGVTRLCYAGSVLRTVATGVSQSREVLQVGAELYGDSGIAAIYATQYKRTQQTVKPLADKLKLPVTQIEAKKTADLVKEIRAHNAGQVVFIAGHNNSVPEIIAAMGGPQLPIIPETEYDNLYILTLQADGTARLLKMKYGSAAALIGNQGMMKP